MNLTTTAKAEAAFEYIAMGFPVIPLCWPNPDGSCGCGRGHEGKSIGKVPLTEHGLNDATQTQAGANEYWGKWPNANVAIVIPQGYFVLDVDAQHGGHESLDIIQEQHAKLPKTMSVITGGGGLHLWFKADGIRNTTAFAGFSGLDIRGIGGYVVAPPSIHRSGNEYAWIDQSPVATAPDWLVKSYASGHDQGAPISQAKENWITKAMQGVNEGQRNDICTRLAGYYLPKMAPDIVREILYPFADRCKLNKISGSFDQELLARLLKELQEVPNIDLSLSGFEDDELKKLLKSLDAREKKERLENFDLDAAVKAAQSSPVAKLGDIWLLGEHRLVCNDSTDREAVQRLMGQSKAAMTFTDPPYNVNYGDHRHSGASQRAIANDNLGEVFEPFLEKACKNILEFTDGAVYICMSSSELHTLQKAFIAAGGHWSTFIIWAKNTFTIGRSDYQRQYEPILYGWREGVSHYWCRDRDQGDVWQVDKPSSSPLHPTMKPLALIERAIQNSSQNGDKVLDTFLGSGSTLIACERTGRTCYGMELEPLYVDIARMRWESFTGEKAKRSEEVK